LHEAVIYVISMAVPNRKVVSGSLSPQARRLKAGLTRRITKTNARDPNLAKRVAALSAALKAQEKEVHALRGNKTVGAIGERMSLNLTRSLLRKDKRQLRRLKRAGKKLRQLEEANPSRK